MEYAIFEYKNAKFYGGKKSIFDFDGNLPIKWTNISNAIHTLINARPVSFKKRSGYNRITEIDDLCKSALIKVNNPYKWTTKNGNERLLFEFIQGKGDLSKSGENLGMLYNSHLQSSRTSLKGNKYKGEVTWNTLYKYLAIERTSDYNKLIGFFKQKLGDEVMKNYALVDAIDCIKENSEQYNEFLELLNDLRYKVLDNGDGVTQYLRGMSALFNNTKVQSAINLNGQIIVPLNDMLKEAILNSKKFATILDGGLFQFKTIITNPNIKEYLDNGFNLAEERV